ncbi:MAG: hypothetical protein KGJ31_02405 [Patescibacteria group bacterium]|nr:hypothetical protein [Patescibacteria group bacterium]
MTVWYLWAIDDDPRTNEYLVKIIGEQNSENLYRDKLCADGVRRNLFRCPKGYSNIRSALVAIPEFNLKTEVFKEGAGEAIVRYDLWKKRVQKSSRQSALLKAIRSHFRS